jgi:hypothetical protein
VERLSGLRQAEIGTPALEEQQAALALERADCRLTAGCVRCSSEAAPVMLRRRATA